MPPVIYGLGDGHTHARFTGIKVILRHTHTLYWNFKKPGARRPAAGVCLV